MFTRSLALIAAMVLAMSFIQAKTAEAGITDARVVVLVSHNAKPYEDALEGIRSCFAANGIKARIEIIRLNGNAAGTAKALEKAGKEKVDLVLPLGSLATSEACKTGNGIPMVAGLIVNMEEIESGSSFAAVLLSFPIEVQLRWIKQMLPDCRHIGILYSPARIHCNMENATRLAQGMGLKLIPQKVESPSEIPSALEYLSKEVDALWGIPDDLVYTPQTAREILLFSFRNKIPLIGISREWVKAGALYALECDYRELGFQCGEKALRLLLGAPPDDTAHEYPGKVVYSINMKTARHMKLKINEALVQGAGQVFK